MDPHKTRKKLFLEELQALAEHIRLPWILAGDFNMVRFLIDRSRDMRGMDLMCRFNDLVRLTGIVDSTQK